MMFAKIRTLDSLGASLSCHPISAATFGKTGGVFAPGPARVLFGDSTASKWPEAIEPVGGNALLFSERVTDRLRTFGFSGIEFYPIEVVRAESVWLEKKAPPVYYWARILGEMPVTVFRDGGQVAPSPHSGLVEFFPKLSVHSRVTIRFDPNNWDGVDFFRLANVYSGRRYCSERVVEAVSKLRCRDIVFARTNENLELSL